MTDALLTRVAVALHGVTPPDPEGALALYGDAAARVVAALGVSGAAIERVLTSLENFDGAVMSNERYGEGWIDGLKTAAAWVRAALTAEPTP